MKKYDSYKDSGIEWIGEIPSHWEILNLRKKPFSFEVGKREQTDLKEVISIGGEHIQNERFFLENIRYVSLNYFENSKNGKIKQGDILLVKDGATIGKAMFVNSLPYEKMMLNEHVYKIEANKFFYYIIITKQTQYQFWMNNQSSAQESITSDTLKSFVFCWPNETEQTTIASYLDRKTAEIDELIADKKRLLELYEEEKTAIINQAVTKGINPNVKMKDSGIEWLGEIPEHWEAKKIGHCVKIVRGGSPRPTGDPKYFFGNYIHWITVKEVTNAVGKYVVGTEEFLTEEGSRFSRIIEPETLLLSNSGATLGVPKISKIRGCINDGSVAFPEIKSFLDRDYLYHFFKSHTDIYREQMKGNGQPNLNTEIIKSTFMPIPSTIEEQKMIVDFIESESRHIEAQKNKTQALIGLLTEYRQALISEVVTGKVKVA